MNKNTFMLSLGMALSVGFAMAENGDERKDFINNLVEEVKERSARNQEQQRDFLNELLVAKAMLLPIINATIAAEFGDVSTDAQVHEVAQEMLKNTEENQAYKKLAHNVDAAAAFVLEYVIPKALVLDASDVKERIVNCESFNSIEQGKFFAELLKSRSPQLSKREFDKNIISHSREFVNNYLDLADASVDLNHDCIDQHGENFCDEVAKVLTLLYLKKGVACVEEKINARITTLNDLLEA